MDHGDRLFAYGPKLPHRLEEAIGTAKLGGAGHADPLLIHGINLRVVPAPPFGETPEDPDTWEKFIDYYNRQAPDALRRSFKLYRFLYWSSTELGSVAGLADSLRADLDQLSGGDPTNFGRKPIVIVAHSMGGLIAREFFRLRLVKGAYAGATGAARVLKLVTLGTPHHGTPLARAL